MCACVCVCACVQVSVISHDVIALLSKSCANQVLKGSNHSLLHAVERCRRDSTECIFVAGCMVTLWIYTHKHATAS